MAEPDTSEQTDNTTPPPTEEEQETQTVNDNVEEPESKEPENSKPDVSARLDVLEKELAALKAMLDTLGYEEPADNQSSEDDTEPNETIEQLFD